MKCEPVSEILSLIKDRLDELSADELRKLAEWVELYAHSKDKERGTRDENDRLKDRGGSPNR
jgi:hypothetical protein